MEFEIHLIDMASQSAVSVLKIVKKRSSIDSVPGIIFWKSPTSKHVLISIDTFLYLFHAHSSKMEKINFPATPEVRKRVRDVSGGYPDWKSIEGGQLNYYHSREQKIHWFDKNERVLISHSFGLFLVDLTSNCRN